MTIDWGEADRWITGEAWVGSRIFEHLRVLCQEIGPRWASSSGERRAVGYIRDEMDGAGLADARLEEFPLKTWEHGETVGLIVGDGPLIGLLPFLSCPAVDLTAPLVDVGFGMPHEVEPVTDRLPGAIAIVNLTPEPFSTPVSLPVRLAQLAAAGAAAAVVVERKSGKRIEYHSATGWHEGYQPGHPLPTLATSREDGGMLRALATDGRSLSIKMQARNFDATGINTLADLPGSSWPDELIVLEAHHDTVPNAPGGNDNASGVVVVMEVARVLSRMAKEAGTAPGCGVRFATWSAEEQTLQGSQAYVERHYGPESLPRLAINLDEVATAPMRGIALQFPHLRNLVQEQLDTMTEGLRCHVLAELDSSSDLFSFSRRGIPTAMPWRWRFVGKHPDSDYHHEPGDTADKVRPRELKVYVALLARLILRLSHIPPREWPANPLDVADIERQIAEETGAVIRTM